jgi:L-malate glycosyltransferase
MALRILHIFPGFALGGSQARLITLANAWGRQAEHWLHASDGLYSAASLFSADVLWREQAFPSLKAGSLPGRLWAIGKALRRLKPDLLLTYNWGAVEVALANRLFVRLPHIHHEDGFGPDEAVRQNPKRVLFRRWALPGARAIIVPSLTLERLATAEWGFPASHIHYIPNGVDLSRYAAPPLPDVLPGVSRQPGELLVGTVGGLRPEKNPVRMVRLFAAAADGLNARLVLVGTGPEDAAIRAEAARLGMADRVILPGFQPDPHRYIGVFDIYGIPSDTEQFPISLVEAMAARLPVVSTDVGDVKAILSEPNRALVAPPQDETALAEHLRRLLTDPALRASLAAANRTRVETTYRLETTIQAYARLYGVRVEA